MKIKLFEQQAKALLSNASEVFYGGAVGGGKSYLLRICAIYYALKYRDIQVYLIRRSYPELVQNHIHGKAGLPALLKEYDNKGLVSFSKSAMTYQFYNNSIIKLAYCSSLEDATKYQGAEITVLLIDEVTQMKAEVFEFLLSRVRLAGQKIEGLPRIITAGNPGGIGHNWVKHRWVEHGTEIWEDEKTGTKRLYVPARYIDNPVLMNDDPLYEKRLENISDIGLRNALKNGDWDIVAGGAIDDVWRTNVHVIRPFKLNKKIPVFRTFDWGCSKPFSCGWWAVMNGEECSNGKIYPAGTLIRVAELYGCGNIPNTGLYLDDTEIGKRIKEKDKYVRTVLDCYTYAGAADTQIFDYRAGGSISDMINKGFGGTCFIRANKTAGSRITGLQLLRQRLSNAIKGEGEALYIFDTCTDFIRTVPVLPRDKINTDDVDTNAEDHIYDETRYMLLANYKKNDIIEIEVG